MLATSIGTDKYSVTFKYVKFRVAANLTKNDNIKLKIEKLSNRNFLKLNRKTNIEFEDNFNRSSVGENWTMDAGRADIIDNQLVI